jgi:hypothetical protein
MVLLFRAIGDPPDFLAVSPAGRVPVNLRTSDPLDYCPSQMGEGQQMIAKEIYEAAETAYNRAIAVAGLVVFQLPDPTDRYLICYFATAIEKIGGCLALAREGQLTSIPILARTILEAWMDFRCLAADPNYVEYIEAKHDEKWVKVFDAAANNNLHLAKLGSEPSVIAGTGSYPAAHGRALRVGSALFKPLNVFNGPTRVSTTLSMIFSALRLTTTHVP